MLDEKTFDKEAYPWYLQNLCYRQILIILTLLIS